MSFNILFSQLYLIRHSGVTWVAGDEQTVFLPGARHFQCPLPSELLLLVWLRFCAARLLVCVSCVCFVSLLVYLFPPSSQHGTKTNYPSKFDSRTLERSLRPSQQPIGRSQRASVQCRTTRTPQPSPLPLAGLADHRRETASHPRSQEERARANGAPTLLPNEIDAAFLLTRPD